MATAFIGLGANLGDRRGSIQAALALLDSLEEVAVTGVSRLRETDPVGGVPQPSYLNAAARIETSLGPRRLLETLLAVERRLGRTRRGPRFGPRVIDLDLLLYGDEIVREAGLTVPHPRLHERPFALEPLLDLEPLLQIPGRGSVASVLAGLDPARTG